LAGKGQANGLPSLGRNGIILTRFKINPSKGEHLPLPVVMRIQKALITTFLFLLVLTFPCKNLFADESQHLSGYHSDYGIKLYNEQRVDLAVNEFVQALFYDSSNVTAKTYLRQAISRFFSEKRGEALQLLRLVDLVEYVDFLKSQSRSVSAGNEALLNFLKIHNVTVPLLGQGITLPTFPIDDTAFETTLKKLDFPRFTALFMEQKQLWTEYLENLQAVSKELRQLKAKTIASLASSKNDEHVNAVASQIQDIKSQMREKDKMIRLQQEGLAYLREELLTARGNFEQIQKKFQETDKKITDVTHQLAGMSLERYQRDKLLADKEARVNELETVIRDNGERWNLSQRIMQEKEERIRSLETQTLELQKNGPSTETTAIASPADAQTESNSQKILALEEQMQNLNDKYLLIEARLQAKDQEIAKLQETVAVKENRLTDFERAFVSKDNKLIELNGIVQIYKGKLENAISSLREKEETLKRLEERLNSVKESNPFHDSLGFAQHE
jgi:hypothetical protein